MNLLFSFSNTSFRYGQCPVLEDVNFEMKEKEFFFFTGNNGAGKSTLVKALLGLVSASSGTINRHIFKSDIGYVPQKSLNNINLPMTVEEFVSLGLNGLLPLSLEQKEERLTWALKHVSLDDLRKYDCQNLSGGQFQKLLVARALVRKPKLLIADEPTNSLDRHSTELFMSTILDLNQKYGMAIIFVTHDYLLIQKYPHHVVDFKDKKISVILEGNNHD